MSKGYRTIVQPTAACPPRGLVIHRSNPTCKCGVTSPVEATEGWPASAVIMVTCPACKAPLGRLFVIVRVETHWEPAP